LRWVLEYPLSGIYRVLAVEDDADMLIMVQVVLRDLPLTMESAHNGAQAISYLRHQTPDLLLLDIGLPDMRGWEILDAIRTDVRLSNMQVIVLTSHSEPVHRLIGMLQPVSAYLNKPLNPRELHESVRQALKI
jgi:DNA-binding response OmpR family regulator